MTKIATAWRNNKFYEIMTNLSLTQANQTISFNANQDSRTKTFNTLISDFNKHQVDYFTILYNQFNLH